MLKNQRYPQKSMFTATDEPTEMPLVVLEYSVGVIGHQHATHRRQFTINILSTFELLEFYTIVTSYL